MAVERRERLLEYADSTALQKPDAGSEFLNLLQLNGHAFSDGRVLTASSTTGTQKTTRAIATPDRPIDAKRSRSRRNTLFGLAAFAAALGASNIASPDGLFAGTELQGWIQNAAVPLALGFSASRGLDWYGHRGINLSAPSGAVANLGFSGLLYGGSYLIDLPSSLSQGGLLDLPLLYVTGLLAGVASRK